MKKIDLSEQKQFFELDDLAKDQKLIEKLEHCVNRQKIAASQVLTGFFKVHPNAEVEVSEERLLEIIEANREVSDIRTQRSISNCISFNSKNLEGSVCSDEILRLRREIDLLLSARVREYFQESKRLRFEDSGMFWYPRGSFMGWHTNARTPGWRMYVNYAEEPGKSFFRYRDPGSKKIITALDKKWNFRIFRIEDSRPFWHCVYSDTNRFSFGYKISIQPVQGQMKRRIAGFVKRLLVSM